MHFTDIIKTGKGAKTTDQTRFYT